MTWIRIRDRVSRARVLDRRRVRDGALAVLAPVVACCAALAGLTAWVGAGRAGSPARVRVTEGRVLLPSVGVPETAAFFRVANDGGSADTLVRITARGVPGDVALSRHVMTRGNTAYRAETDSVSVAAGERLAMSPIGVDLTVPVPSKAWRSGDLVPFTLEFRRSGPVRVLAVVVRPGTVSAR
ncbi:copper chaperone PCu(A)C [Streptomyces sp. SID8366]|uniref:copper chaperone PCu(A)C n=1 Tax=unclassified Streptomyces TaxID=2593676 RepID=UPI000DB9EF1E|nr:MULTISPECIES: copper chaperone PCu(A)C [unclassified Streptomyces]MYU07225.1 copper chaperone PCu(A)C [Streptomyces sp. SID8366]MYU67330.1 copper chaperone PCu(A)C [Streptomyces sp. SID69]RAJ61474.1 copper(I)-binding protein [Streptomyces sp. PsTaAH-130]